MRRESSYSMEPNTTSLTLGSKENYQCKGEPGLESVRDWGDGRIGRDDGQS